MKRMNVLGGSVIVAALLGCVVLAPTAAAQQITDPTLITLQHDFETDPPTAPPPGPFTLGNATFSEASTGSGAPGWRILAGIFPGSGNILTDNAGITDITIDFATPVAAAGLNVGVGPAEYQVDFFNGATLLGTVVGTTSATGDNFFAGWGNAAGITSIRITEPTGENGLVGGIDDVRYNAIPAPGALALLCVAGLGARRRRRA